MTDSLVSVRDRRERAIARISEGYAQDLIDVDELERRLDLAHGARTVAELDALVADLAEPAAAGTALVAPSTAAIAIDDPGRAEHKRLRAIMSSVERKGRWVVPRALDVRVFWGSVVLDFRDASFGPGVTTIEVKVTMGSLEVILPPDLAVDIDVSAFAGNVEERHRIPPQVDPTRPVLRFTGAVRFGNLETMTRLPGESRRDARRRERGERKQLRAAARRALPPGS